MSMAKKTKRKILVVGIIAALIALIIIFYPKKSVAPKNTVLVSSASVAPTVSSQVLADLKWPSNRTVSVRILMYHHVGPLPADADDIRKGLTVSTENFDKQLEQIKNSGFRVATMAGLYEAVAKGEDTSKTIVLTFDDGYDDNFSYAWEAMKKYDFVGTFFIISGKIGQAEYMTEGQIKELAAAGNEIGSHTVTHPSLEKLSSGKLETELVDSKAALEKLTGRAVISLCYPAGKFSDVVEKAVEQAGYKTAVTTAAWKPFSTDKPFEVPRQRMSDGTDLKKLL